jgi:hypothetical protein
MGPGNRADHFKVGLFFFGRAARRLALFAIAVIVTLIILVAGWVAIDGLLVDAYYAKRPFLQAMRSAPLLSGGPYDSAPAKKAFLQYFPLGTSKSKLITAVTDESFECSAAGTREPTVTCGIAAKGAMGLTTRWTLFLDFDANDQLSNARIQLGHIWF